MLPSPWPALVLALAAYRILRLIGWDDFPPVLRARRWLVGEQTNRRPLLAHFLACPFCVGFWISAAVYVAWLLFPTETLYAAAPFALSGTIGLIAKNLDP